MAWKIVAHEGDTYLMATEVPKTDKVPTGWVGRLHELNGRKVFTPKDAGMTQAQFLETWYKFGNYEYASNEDYIEAGGDPDALDEEFDPANIYYP